MVPFSLSVENTSSYSASFYYKTDKDCANSDQSITQNPAVSQVGGINTHIREGCRILGEYQDLT